MTNALARPELHPPTIHETNRDSNKCMWRELYMNLLWQDRSRQTGSFYFVFLHIRCLAFAFERHTKDQGFH